MLSSARDSPRMHAVSVELHRNHAVPVPASARPVPAQCPSQCPPSARLEKTTILQNSIFKKERDLIYLFKI